MLLTTREVAALLKVHPKHVYRLRKRGLPAHRVGDEWRFDEDEVRAYCRGRADEVSVATAPAASAPGSAPPLFAANGDMVVELLLREASESAGAVLGHVPTDHAGGLSLLRKRAVLIAGCHGDGRPTELADLGVARVHLVEREVGLVFRRGLSLRRVGGIVGRRFAGRPGTAGIRAHLDAALVQAGIEPEAALADALVCRSHRDVVMAICRGEAEVGVATQAWASSAGLGFLPIASEAYGLVVRTEDLGNPLVATLCEVAQRGSLRRKLSSSLGYAARRTGELRLHPAKP